MPHAAYCVACLRTPAIQHRAEFLPRPLPRNNTPPREILQSVLMEYLDVDWKTDQFAELLFGDYLNREDKVWCLFS